MTLEEYLQQGLLSLVSAQATAVLQPISTTSNPLQRMILLNASNN